MANMTANISNVMDNAVKKAVENEMANVKEDILSTLSNGDEGMS